MIVRAWLRPRSMESSRFGRFEVNCATPAVWVYEPTWFTAVRSGPSWSTPTRSGRSGRSANWSGTNGFGSPLVTYCWPAVACCWTKADEPNTESMWVPESSTYTPAELA